MTTPQRCGWRRSSAWLCRERDEREDDPALKRAYAAIVERLDREAWDRYVAAEAVERESITRTVQTWRTLATESAR
jgi:hypothetical protein